MTVFRFFFRGIPPENEEIAERDAFFPRKRKRKGKEGVYMKDLLIVAALGIAVGMVAIPGCKGWRDGFRERNKRKKR